MKDRTTQVLLSTIAALLLANLAQPMLAGRGQAQEPPPIPGVLRAHVIELVNDKGEVRAQLHLGEDGGGNLRLRDSEGTVRVKMGGGTTGSGLILFDSDTEPAVWARADETGTSLKLSQRGKEPQILQP